MAGLENIPTAETSYKDWLGTAAAEDSMVVGSGDLYELAGLDTERWSIVGIDVFTHSHGDDPDWRVMFFAYDKQANQTTDHASMSRLYEDRKSLPVVEHTVHNASLDDVIRCMKVIHIQLRRPGFDVLDRVGYSEHPASNAD